MTTLSRVRTVFTGVAGTPWYSNLYFTWVTGEAQNLVDAVDDFWTVIIGQINGAVTGTVEGSVAQINDATGDITSVESVTPGTIDFTGSGAVLPPANQTVINLHTGTYVAGREIRGKIFVPGLIAAASATDGSPSSGFLVAQKGAADALVAATSSAGPLRVYSPTHATSAVVTATSSMSQFAVMRSRRD